MNIRQLDLSNLADVYQWVEFPYQLYKNDPVWVPPLRGSARANLDPNRHPYSQHSNARFYVAEADGQTLGRIALIESRFNHIDTVQVREDNYQSFSDNLTMGVTWYKRHRVYQRSLK